MTRFAPTSLDPGDATQANTIFRRDLDRLLFDTLVTVDDFGRIQPALALSWKSQPGFRAWQFWIRSNAKFDDGSPLTPTSAATSLRAVNARWAVSALADSILVETDTAEPNLPVQLAQTKYSIVKRIPAKILGTGPFHVSDWQAGKSVTMEANDDYWAGRPFVNAVEISFGKSFRDQLFALQLGRTDLVEVPPDQARRSPEARRPTESAPIVLGALVFSRDPQSSQERKLREALALSIDRVAIKKVLLQGNGEPAGSLLPNWLTGYSFLFATQPDVQKARQQRSEFRQAVTWTLGYDVADPLSRLIAERVALNAREVGITVQPLVNGTDMRLVTIPLASIDGPLALRSLAESLGLPAPEVKDSSPEALYHAEAALLDTERIIPLFHLPVNYAVNPSVKNWRVRRDGTRDLGDVWLGTEKP